MNIIRIIRLLGVFLAFCLTSTTLAQCESIGIGGTHYQIIMTLPLEGEAPDYWETSALDGTIIDQDSDGNNNHFAFNPDFYDNIVTCIYFAEAFCCVEYFYDEDDGWVLVVDDVAELLYINLECDLYCDETGAYYNAILFFDNIGNTTITNFCINYDVLSGPDVIECFEGELPPGESVTMEFGPITSDGGGGVTIRLETLEGEETDITWTQPIACYFDATTTCIFGCTDPEASNYDPNAEWDDGTCNYDIYGCTDVTALNYNPDSNVDDGSCIYDIPGCTDPSANNYNSLATINDGSCTYDILGCTDPDALNYNPAANVDDGSCEYPIPGCTDPAALNYNEFATVEDGSCEYLEGCTDLEAINYNSLAILDDGSCIYPSEDCDKEYFAPNTFTPNNDGYNDGWGVTVADENCWKEWNVQIYNRWGSLVWESSKLGETWTASVGNGNYYVADGVYVYRVYGVGWDSLNTFTATGHITIFK